MYLTHWARRHDAEQAVTHVLVDVTDPARTEHPHRLVPVSAAYVPSAYPSPGLQQRKRPSRHPELFFGYAGQ